MSGESQEIVSSKCCVNHETPSPVTVVPFGSTRNALISLALRSPIPTVGANDVMDWPDQ